MTAVFLDLPEPAIALLLLANFLGGMGLGWAYFRLVWRSARQFAEAGGLPKLLLASLGRLVLLGSVLMLASRQGALPVLLVAAGLVLARFLALRRAREVVA